MNLKFLHLTDFNITLKFFFSCQNLNTSGKTTSNTDGPKFPGDKSSTTQNNNQQKKGIQVLPDGETLQSISKIL